MFEIIDCYCLFKGIRQKFKHKFVHCITNVGFFFLYIEESHSIKGSKSTDARMSQIQHHILRVEKKAHISNGIILWILNTINIFTVINKIFHINYSNSFLVSTIKKNAILLTKIQFKKNTITFNCHFESKHI